MEGLRKKPVRVFVKQLLKLEKKINVTWVVAREKKKKSRPDPNSALFFSFLFFPLSLFSGFFFLFFFLFSFLGGAAGMRHRT